MNLEYFEIDYDKKKLKEKLTAAFKTVDNRLLHFYLYEVVDYVNSFSEHKDILTERVLLARREEIHSNRIRKAMLSDVPSGLSLDEIPVEYPIFSSFIDNFWRLAPYTIVLANVLNKVAQVKEDKEINFVDEYMRYFNPYQFCDCCELHASYADGEKSLEYHLINGDETNFLPTNFYGLCPDCAPSFTGINTPIPFVVITKTFKFAAAHFLPDHKSLCSYWHGHEWKLEVEVKNRVNPETQMVMDFADLKKIVNKLIIDKLDHNVLNDYLCNPTAENLLVWIWEQLMFKGKIKGLNKLTLWESDTSCASLTQEGLMDAFTFTLAGRE